ncbi:MAG: stage II sporulation protein D [Clostridia bacterium]|nr:stage II sporulation protein D [Clostridia bacterium]
MRKFLILSVMIALFSVLTPLLAKKKPGEAVPVQTAYASPPAETADASQETVAVFSHETGRTEDMSMTDYIIGVVAAEMPAEYEKEALKAQALAAITYTRYVTADGGSISTDSAVNQSYKTNAELQTLWGDAYEENYKKIRDAVAAVENLSIIYEGKPILAAYFAISGGRTENASDIWGGNYPYLRSTASDGDTLSPAAETRATFSANELYEKLNAVHETAACDEPEHYIGNTERTAAGAVVKISIGGTDYSGTEVRTALGLASPDFEVNYDGEQFVFTAHGYGHLVGMSQYGADYMARQGADFREILLHYYTGAEIVAV